MQIIVEATLLDTYRNTFQGVGNSLVTKEHILFSLEITVGEESSRCEIQHGF